MTTRRRWGRLMIGGLWLAVAATALAASDVVVPIDLAAIAARPDGAATLAQVEVTDLRKAAQMERTTIGGVSLGMIRFEPAVPEIVQALVSAKADTVLARRAVGQPVTVSVGIRDFDVVTPATLLYWDVRSRVALVLRVRGQDREVSAAATERTFVWPSQEMIARVAAAALRQLGAEVERALDELLQPAP